MFTGAEIRYPDSIAFFVSMEEVFRQEKDILPGKELRRGRPRSEWVDIKHKKGRITFDPALGFFWCGAYPRGRSWVRMTKKQILK
jgi:hypothetical protein